MIIKKSTKCGVEKDSSCFYKQKHGKFGLFAQCKECTGIHQKKYHDSIKDKRKRDSAMYYLLNKEKVLKRNKEWRIKNKDAVKKINERSRIKNIEKILLRRKLNSKRIAEVGNEYKKRRMKEDGLFKLKIVLRNRITQSLKSKGLNKNKKTENILGASVVFVKSHLESMFKDGMSWSNHGKWHIDHIIPLSSAKTEEDMMRLLRYDNLQPLWAKDNLTKSKKIIKK